MIYITTFLLSLLFALFAYKFPKKSLVRKIFFAMSLLLPCALASMRSCNIGTDVKVYAENWFDIAAKSKSFMDFLSHVSSPDLLYLAITYASAKICGRIWLLFFIAQLLTISPIAYVAYKKGGSRQYLISMVIYYLFFYNISLNLMRQSISLSMSLVSYYFLMRKDTKKYLLFTAIALLFHFSGILGVSFYLVSKIKKRSTRRLFVIACFASTIVLILFFSNIIEWLCSVGIMPDRYLSYTSRYLRSRITIDFIREIYFAMILAVSLLCSREDDGIKLLSIAGFLLFQVGLVSNFAYRISYIFFYPALFIQIPKYLADKNAKNAKILLLVLLAGMSLYWVQQIVILRIHETYPYELMENNK